MVHAERSKATRWPTHAKTQATKQKTPARQAVKKPLASKAIGKKQTAKKPAPKTSSKKNGIPNRVTKPTKENTHKKTRLKLWTPRLRIAALWEEDQASNATFEQNKDKLEAGIAALHLLAMRRGEQLEDASWLAGFQWAFETIGNPLAFASEDTEPTTSDEKTLGRDSSDDDVRSEGTHEKNTLEFYSCA